MKAFTVYYDGDNGEMTRVDWTPGFQNEGALLRADVLKDARMRRMIDRKLGLYVTYEDAAKWREVADVVGYVQRRMGA